jgi:ribosomal-protein-alanine N-acetyltransferase
VCPYCSRVQQESIRADRVELVWLSPDWIESLLEGERDDLVFEVPEDWPNEHDRRFLTFRLRQAREEPERARWYVYAIVLGGRMIGNIGFHGPPGSNARKDPEAVEIGYRVFESYQRQGYATEAVRALIGWTREQGVERIIASVGPENEPSLAIVRRLGFREVGRHWDDEDGEELEFVLEAHQG